MGEFGLIGKKAIKEYSKYGWKKIKKLVKEQGFPVWFDGDFYISDKMLIDDWRRRKIKESVGR